MKHLIPLLSLSLVPFTTALGVSLFPRQGVPISGNSTRELKNCPQPDDAFLKISDEMAIEEGNVDDNSTVSVQKRAEVKVNTWVHVVAVNRTEKGGWVSDDTIHKQINVMNKSYQPRNFGFTLKGITRTVNKDLAIIKDNEPISKLGRRLRKGDYATLNLYIVQDMPDNVAGDCPFPGPNPSLPNDGCRFVSTTLPDVSNGDGLVVIHEIGHWLGLLHTFQECDTPGCTPTCTTGHGDKVKDTPVHLQPHDLECTPRDTCPGKAGKDPVHNFMNYSPTKCFTHFTDGQGKRMHNMWTKFRKNQ